MRRTTVAYSRLTAATGYLLWTIVVAAPVAASDGRHFEAARNLFLAGEYARALGIIEPLVVGNDRQAQYLLGEAHENGHGGLPVNLSAALDHYLNAANAGDRCARRRVIEIMFFLGERSDELPISSISPGEFSSSEDWKAGRRPFVLNREFYEKEADHARIVHDYRPRPPARVRRYGRIVEVAWLRAAIDDGYPAVWPRYLWRHGDLTDNELAIAKRLAKETVDGRFWYWVDKLMADWPEPCP